jgi:hypothetical protein
MPLAVIPTIAEYTSHGNSIRIGFLDKSIYKGNKESCPDTPPSRLAI